MFYCVLRIGIIILDADVKPTSTPVLSTTPPTNSEVQLDLVLIVVPCTAVGVILLFSMVVVIVVLAIKYQQKKLRTIDIQTDREEKVYMNMYITVYVCVLISLYCSCRPELFAILLVNFVDFHTSYYCMVV